MTYAETTDWRYLFRIALGVVFIWAALAKIADPAGFAQEIHHFRILPGVLDNIAALMLPWVELVAGLALILNFWPRAALLVTGGLLVVFMLAILAAIIRKLDIECGCFGTQDAASTGWVTLIRDVVFIALAILGWPRRSRVHQVAAEMV